MGLKSGLRQRLAVKGTDGVQGRDVWLDNDDIRPLSVEDRTWTQKTYFTFWFSAVATVATWYGGSAAQSFGLNLWEVLGCQVAGWLIAATIFVLNGRPGAVYHVGFPVNCRAAFGVFGGWWPTFNRAVMATVWNGVNGVQGGQCVYAMLHAMFPGIATLPNIMGKGSALDSGGFIGYVIFWIVICCFLHIPIPKMRVLVYIKLVVYLVSAITMLAWCLTLAGGPGPVVRQPSQVHGSEKAWLMIRFFFLAIGNVATFASNASDFQRYAKKPNDVILGNVLGFPLADLTVCLVGNIVASSSVLVLGELEWNPLTYLDRIQSNNYTPANRAGVFFVAFMFAYSALFSSVFENSIPAGNDYAALFPQYISIKTGMYICQVISVLINPWYLLGSASVFINFLASYQVFLSAITGVLMCNYWVVSRGYYKMEDLFTARKDGAYYFTKGWNIRAYVAYVLAIAPNFAGFLGNMGVSMPMGVTRAYYMAYPIGLIVSFVTFWVSNLVKRPAIMLTGWHEPKNYYRPEEDPELTSSVIEGAEVETSSRGDDASRAERIGTGADEKRATTSVQEKSL